MTQTGDPAHDPTPAEPGAGDEHPPGLAELFANNRGWCERTLAQDPEFFSRLAGQQSPEYLWIGCSDSRVPSNQIIDVLPGAVFVHRNVANVVVHTDLNCLSVVQFAVNVLQVKHVIVCGHYGCGGVNAAMHGHRLGLIDNWLRHVRDVHRRHDGWLAAIENAADRADRLCELNVIEQVANVCQSTVLVDAWGRDQAIAVHGCIYGVSDGRLRWLGLSVDSASDVETARVAAVQGLMLAHGGA